MDAAEMFIESLDLCEVCGTIVEKGDLSECLNTDCGLRYCVNCYCPCPVIAENEEEAAFLREENPDVEVIIDPDFFAEVAD